MSKVDLAKKTAKLMVDKLSSEELENELYQLLILLSESDIKYAYTDVRSGEIAGTPHPVDALQGGDDRDDDRHPVDELQGTEDRVDLSETKLKKIEDVLESTLQKVGKERGVEVHYSQDMIGQYVYFVDTLDGDESDYVVYVSEDEDDSSKYGYSISKHESKNKESDILIYGSTDTFDELIDVLEKNATKFKTQLLSNNARWEGEDEDANAGESWWDRYEVEYHFNVPDTQDTAEYAEDFEDGEDIYIYDEELDRWIQHEIVEVREEEERGENTYVVEPIGDFGPTALLFAPFTEKEVKRKGKYSPIYEDDYVDSELTQKIKSHPDVEDAYMDEMSGVLYIVFKGWKALDDSNNVTVAATPGWGDGDEAGIPIQIWVSDGEDDDNYGGESISLEHPQFYVQEDGVYPSKEKYQQLYYDKIGQIKEEAEEVYVNQVRGKIEGKVLEENQWKLEEALEKWEDYGSKDLTREDKDLILHSDGVHTDYGWHEVVEQFIYLYGNPETLGRNSLDEMGHSDWDWDKIEEQDMEDKFKSILTRFQNEFDFEEYRAEDYYDDDLTIKAPANWHI